MSYPSENLVLSKRLTEIPRGKRSKIENQKAEQEKEREKEGKRGAAITTRIARSNPEFYPSYPSVSA